MESGAGTKIDFNNFDRSQIVEFPAPDEKSVGLFGVVCDSKPASRRVPHPKTLMFSTMVERSISQYGFYGIRELEIAVEVARRFSLDGESKEVLVVLFV